MRSRFHRNMDFCRPDRGAAATAAAATAATIASDDHLIRSFTVDNDLELLGLARRSGKFDLYEIFAFDGELAMDCQTASRAERQAIDAGVLRLLVRYPIPVHHHRCIRVADGEPADLLSGFEIALHCRRRYKQQVRDIVETAARIVFREQ